MTYEKKQAILRTLNKTMVMDVKNIRLATFTISE